MDECSKRVPGEAATEIVQPYPAPYVPGIARIGEHEQSARQLRNPTQQRGPVGIAADHPMHRDDIRRNDGAVEVHDIASEEIYASGCVAPIRLGPRSAQVRG